MRFWEAREVVACLARAGEAGANSQPGSSIPTLCGHSPQPLYLQLAWTSDRGHQNEGLQDPPRTRSPR